MKTLRFPSLIPGFTLARTMIEVGGLAYRVVRARGTLVKIRFDETGKAGWSIPEPPPGEIGHLITCRPEISMGIDAFDEDSLRRAQALAYRLNRRIVGGPRHAPVPGWPGMVMSWWKTIGNES